MLHRCFDCEISKNLIERIRLLTLLLIEINTFYFFEMSIICTLLHLILGGYCCNPNVIFGNGVTLVKQRCFNYSIIFGCMIINIQNYTTQ